MKHPRRTFSIGAIVAVCSIALAAQSTISANAEVAPPASNGTIAEAAPPARPTSAEGPAVDIESGAEDQAAKGQAAVGQAAEDGAESQAIGPAVPPKGIEKIARERAAKAIAINKAVLKALKAGKSSSFKDANGKKHTIAVVRNEIVLDGKKVRVGGAHSSGVAAVSGDSLLCKFKIAAALSAILGLGGVAIGFFVAPLAATTTVALAGLTFSASTWTAIAASLGSVSIVAGFVHDVVC